MQAQLQGTCVCIKALDAVPVCTCLTLGGCACHRPCPVQAMGPACVPQLPETCRNTYLKVVSTIAGLCSLGSSVARNATQMLQMISTGVLPSMAWQGQAWAGVGTGGVLGAGYGITAGCSGGSGKGRVRQPVRMQCKSMRKVQDGMVQLSCTTA